MRGPGGVRGSALGLGPQGLYGAGGVVGVLSERFKVPYTVALVVAKDLQNSSAGPGHLTSLLIVIEKEEPVFPNWTANHTTRTDAASTRAWWG